MIRAVLDTNVFLRALINPHSYCGRLLTEFVDQYELVLSPAIIREVLEVLQRPRLLAKLPQITQIDVVRLITLFEGAHVIDPPEVPSVSRDPKDDMFLACARLANANYLITEDKDLLVLAAYETTQICRPSLFIEHLLTKKATQLK
ncbi:MAG: putative toxin-antitoxin system toxin component, PIN family [Chloroflexota bacterium]